MSSSPIRIRRTHPTEWQRLREIRLAALADTPMAFRETYAGGLAQPAAYWRQRAADGAAGVAKVTFLALRGDTAVGMAGGMRIDGPPARVDVVALWLRPDVRGTGTIGRGCSTRSSAAGTCPTHSTRGARSRCCSTGTRPVSPRPPPG